MQMRALSVALDDGGAATRIKIPFRTASKEEHEAYIRQFSWSDVDAALVKLCSGQFLPQSFTKWCKQPEKHETHMEELKQAGQAI
jgi:hypothetical protein